MTPLAPMPQIRQTLAKVSNALKDAENGIREVLGLIPDVGSMSPVHLHRFARLINDIYVAGHDVEKLTQPLLRLGADAAEDVSTSTSRPAHPTSAC